MCIFRRDVTTVANINSINQLCFGSCLYIIWSAVRPTRTYATTTCDICIFHILYFRHKVLGHQEQTHILTIRINSLRFNRTESSQDNL